MTKNNKINSLFLVFLISVVIVLTMNIFQDPINCSESMPSIDMPKRSILFNEFTVIGLIGAAGAIAAICFPRIKIPVFVGTTTGGMALLGIGSQREKELLQSFSTSSSDSSSSHFVHSVLETSNSYFSNMESVLEVFRRALTDRPPQIDQSYVDYMLNSHIAQLFLFIVLFYILVICITNILAIRLVIPAINTVLPVRAYVKS